MRKVLLLITFISATIVAVAQTGTIAGVITDSKTAEAITGANVFIQGTQVGSATDLDGKFIINNVKPGTYNLMVSFITYKTHLIPDVEVEANNKTSVTVALIEDAHELQEVVVAGTRQMDTDFSLVNAIRESKLVVSGISAEQISKSQDRDAAQVVRRVPGVTLQDNRFVVVRGLSSRYSTVLLNGVIAPSTETESRAFSFDIISSSLLDRILVYKSGAAELPGEFAGSVIQVSTKSAVESNFTNFSISGGYRANTTFNTFKSQSSSPTDFLGFDNGSRNLPEGAPSNYKDIAFDIPRLVEESQKFENKWTINSTNAVPDLRMSFDLGRAFDLGSISVSTLNSINYSNTLQYNQIKRYRYTNYEEESRESSPFFAFTDDQYNRNVRIGLLSNWTFRLNSSSKIEFRNLYTRLGTTETTLRTGSDVDKGQDVQNYSLRYINRGIYTGQIEGTHDIGDNDKAKLTWLAGLTSGMRSEPDWRRVSSRRNSGTENPFQVLVPQNANASDASRFYQNLSEINLTTRLDFEYKLNAAKADPFLIKVGYWGEYKSRDFQARSIGYIKASSNFDPAIGALPYDKIFAKENIKYPDGLVISENSKYTDTYDASNLLLAGYGSVTMPLSEKIRFIPGVRVEFNHQKLETAPNVSGSPDEVDNPITTILPFANISYNLNPTSLIRLAYSKTINRPEFREIAPFSFYDFNFEVDVIGNTGLKVADIHNADIRWEYYPTPNELLSVGAFYKYFINPIETIIRTGANNPVLQYSNGTAAQSAGVEVEIRKSLSYRSGSKFLNNISTVFNIAYILSEIDLGSDVTLTQEAERPMQGQSPFVVNSGLYYHDMEKGLQISAQYNVYGRRIFSVGDKEFPTIWEMPRHLVDLTISKRVLRTGEIRFGVSDLLNSKISYREDGNLDGKISSKETDKPILDTRNGQYVTLGFVYRFN
jgi:hypothetical protein